MTSETNRIDYPASYPQVTPQVKELIKILDGK